MNHPFAGSVCRPALFLALFLLLPPATTGANDDPFCRSELLFPLETWHNHGSCIVELPNGDLLVCWFHGSGERTADDVIIEGARLKKGSREWSSRFTLSDAADLPDGNPCMFIDPQERLWLIHTTILANTWESALLKIRISRDYLGDGPPRWESSEVLHIKPGPEFEEEVNKRLPAMEQLIAKMKLTDEQRREADDFLHATREHASDKLYKRLGWMTRAHPLLLGSQRLIVPLYHDGFSFSLMAISDDWGRTWHTSAPLVGAGNIQPSIAQRADGSLYTLMRDNGPPPKRLLQSESRDRGETWSAVTDSDLLNSGTGAEIITLHNGHWVLINNDTETGRHQLAVQISDDEGRTWKWKRYLEQDLPGPESGRFHYPSIIEAKDGTLHASYSYHLHRSSLPRDVDGDPAGKSIKHAHFNVAWVKQGTQASTKVPGTVIDHSPRSSGLYIGSPSLAVLTNGDYVASHDFFGPKSGEHEKARSVVFRSSDRGRNWRRVSEIHGAFWSSLFVHRGALYLLGPDRHHGNVLIHRSVDGGETWTTPSNAQSGLLRDDGEYHCAPMPVIEHNGRLWRAIERRVPPVAWGVNYRAGMLSADVNADLLQASSWKSSNFLPSDRNWNGGDMGAWLEGNAVVTPDGELVNILRVQTRSPDEKAAIVRVSPDGKIASFDHETGFIDFPGGAKKFAIRFDRESGKYWSLASIVHERHRASNPGGIRNTLALTSSRDLRNWEVRCILLYHPDVKNHGFQYVDWLLDGPDIIAACRTAYDDGVGGANNNHDANYLTFHRFPNFRNLTMADSVVQ